VRIHARELVAPIAAAVAGAALLAWLGLTTMAFTDYEAEAEPSLLSLRAGDVGDFLEKLPAYGGSLILRAPFALLPGVWGGGDLALFRTMAVPALAAGAALGVFLWARGRRLGRGRAAAWLALLLVAVNPLSLRALEVGHSEELLGAALCVAAALAAGARRPVAAGVLIGLAVANKPWALVAAAPALLMLETGRVRALLTAGGVAGAVLAPLVVAGAAGLHTGASIARETGQIFQPWQLWWFLGEHAGPVFGMFGEKPGYRTPPAWLTQVSHPLVLAAPLALCVAARRRLRDAPWHEGLLLLALVLLLRCLLDTWNTSYYAVPFLLALTAWELHARPGPPLVALGATLAAWTSFELLPRLLSPDLQAAAYLAWSVPLAAALAWRLLDPEGWRSVAEVPGRAVRRRLPTLGRVLGPARA
jgi:hypothetical protein